MQSLRERLPDWLRQHTSEAKYSPLPSTQSRTSQVSNDGYKLDSEHPRPVADGGPVWRTHLPPGLGAAIDWLEDHYVPERRRFALVLLCSLGAVTALVALLAQLPLFGTDRGIDALAAFSAMCTLGTFDQPGWFLHRTNTSITTVSERPLRMLGSQRMFSRECADLWISKGELCAGLHLGNVGVDVVWTFIEPSEHWQAWEEAYKVQATGDPGHKSALTAKDEEGTGLKLFRSYDEIKYSLRSVVENVPFAGRLTLLGTSLPAEQPRYDEVEGDESTTLAPRDTPCQVAQIPDWLDPTKVDLVSGVQGDSSSRLRVLSYWDLFAPYKEALSPRSLAEWREHTLPTFNSHSIESQLANLPTTDAEVLLYLNNDNYVGRTLSPADLASHLFGTVARIYPSSWSHGVASVGEAMEIDGNGNARSMPNTVRLLDERFGKRDRNYLEHIGVTMSVPLLDEVARVWAAELKETAEVRFRGRGAEYWLPLLSVFYTVEKQREALLWSFLVAKSDPDGSSTYSLAERQALLANLGVEREGDVLHVPSPQRAFMTGEELVDALHATGSAAPNWTGYTWSSANGYPYIGPSSEEGNHQIFPDYRWPSQPRFAWLSIVYCFGREDFFDEDSGVEEVDVQEVFKRVAFERPKCGDYIYAALLAASGEKGFEAFLPSPTSKTPEGQDLSGSAVPVLGQWHAHYDKIDWSLDTALKTEHGTWNARGFAVRLVQRYAFSFGQSPTSFNELVDDVGWDGWFLEKMGNDRNAFIGLNEDIKTDNLTVIEQIRELVTGYHERLWPNATIYELEQS